MNGIGNAAEKRLAEFSGPTIFLPVFLTSSMSSLTPTVCFSNIKAPWFALILILLLFLIGSSLHSPLQAVHWDTPIYLYHGERFAETPLLRDYSQSARTIAAMVDGVTITSNKFWSPYWHFMRLGHIVVVGSVFSIFSTRDTAIEFLRWLFPFFMCLVVLLVFQLLNVLSAHLKIKIPRNELLWGGVASASCFLISDICGYLGRSVVSETPALLFLTGACLTLVVGQHDRSISWSIAAGILAFLSYVTRFETIWSFLALFPVLFYAQRRIHSDLPWCRGYLAALSGALTFWLLYSAYFFPLTNPLLFLAFRANEGISPLEASVYRISAANGLLLPGAIVYFSTKLGERVWMFLATWLTIALLPTVPHLLADHTMQTRMFVPFVFIPAYFASSYCWANLLMGFRVTAKSSLALITATALCLALTFSSPEVHRNLRTFPGGWRVVPVLELLEPLVLLPPWEKRNYNLEESRSIAEIIDAAHHNKVVVALPPLIDGKGLLYLLRMYSSRPELSIHPTMSGEPVFHGYCLPIEQMTAHDVRQYCTTDNIDKINSLVAEFEHVFILDDSHSRSNWGNLNDLPASRAYLGKDITLWHAATKKLTERGESIRQYGAPKANEVDRNG
jgi:hypothetical protein